MYTQCPECDTVFSIQAWQLQKARGYVRCGVCESAFHALSALSDTAPDGDAGGGPSGDGPPAPGSEEASGVPDEVFAAGPTAEGPDRSASQMEPFDEGAEAQLADEIRAEVSPSAPEGATATGDPAGEAEPQPDDFSGLDDLRADPAPPYSEKITEELFEQWAAEGMDFTRKPPRGARRASGPAPAEDDGSEEPAPDPGPPSSRPPPESTGPAQSGGRSRGRAVLWTLVVAALLGAAVVQATWLFRDEMAAQPWLRGWVEGVCSVLGCSVAAPFDAAHLDVQDRFLEPHPQQEGQMVLGAVLVNRADRAMGYPDLLIELEDLDGHPTGSGSFSPHRYLGDGRLRARLDEGMPPGQEVPVRLVFEAPEAGVDSFSLEFRAPDS